MLFRSACTVGLLALLCLLALPLIAAASDRLGALHPARKLAPSVAQPVAGSAADAVAAPLAPRVAAAEQTSPSSLSHPQVQSISLSRSAGPSRKARAKAAQGHPAYQRIVEASAYGGAANKVLYQEQVAALQRHQERMLANDGPAFEGPTPTVAAFLGCPFSDFTIPVSIGASVFQLLIDTGSSTLALAGSACTTCSNVNPKWAQSTTSVNQNRPSVSGTYGDQSSWTGSVWSDSVQILSTGDQASATAVTDPVTARIVVISAQSTPGYASNGAVNSQADYFFLPDACNDNPSTRGTVVVSQGIIGMAFQSLAISGTDSFVAALWAQRTTAQQLAVPRIFAIQMCEHSGTLWMGGWDSSAFSGSIVWTPLTGTNPATQRFWSVLPANMHVGTTDLQLTSSNWPVEGVNGGYNIVDSGTTLWELPAVVYRRVRDALLADPNFRKYFRFAATNNFFDNPSSSCEAALDASGKVVSGATLQQQLPTISITFQNGATLTMDGVGSYLLPCTKGYNQWVPGIASGSGLLGGWPLMNQFITIHDADSMRVGFAPVTGSCGGTLLPRAAAVSMADGSCASGGTACQNGQQSSSSSSGGSIDKGSSGSNNANSSGSNNIDGSRSSTGTRGSGSSSSSSSGGNDDTEGDLIDAATGAGSLSAAAALFAVLVVFMQHT